MTQNSFPLIEWHLEHAEKTVLKYVKGLSSNPTYWERRNHKKYGSLNSICRQIEYDIKHGVTKDQIISLMQRIRKEKSYSIVRTGQGSMDRLLEIEEHFTKPPKVVNW